jgi:hypothetical protein
MNQYDGNNVMTTNVIDQLGLRDYMKDAKKTIETYITIASDEELNELFKMVSIEMIKREK